LKKFFHIILFVAIVFAVDSCQITKTNLTELNCPKSKPVCSPTKYTAIPRDTSALLGKIQGWYYKIEPVSQVNSTGDEWAISFNNNTPYLTISDGNKNSVLICKYLNYNKIIPQRTMELPENGSYGFPAFFQNTILFAFAKDYSIDKHNEFTDASGRVLVPISESIGQSRLTYFTTKKQNLNQIEINGMKSTDWYSQPCFSNDGKIIFFASDRIGSYGGTDIWMAYYNNGNISEPINCGNVVNTGCDEITPFLSPDGKYLYFSSNGGETIGGYDIFRVQVSDLLFQEHFINKEELEQQGIFKNRENLRAPINTQYNEISPYCLGKCDSIFYYSSNQIQQTDPIHNLGNFDIFVRYKVFVKDTSHKKSITEPNLTIENKEDLSLPIPQKDWFYKLAGKVFSNSTKQPLAGAEIIAQETSSSTKNTTVSDSQGNYSLPMIKNEEYLVTAQTAELFPQNVKIFVGNDDTTKTYHQDFYLTEIYTLRVNFPTDVYNNPYRFVLDSNGNETNVTWEEDLTALANNIILVKDKIIKIVLVGHTDDVASVEYNQKLGERRVNFIIDQLVKRGVPRDILEGRSAGKLEPLTQREDEPLDLYRKRLRRVVLEKIQK
jgi:hypothetical protein